MIRNRSCWNVRLRVTAAFAALGLVVAACGQPGGTTAPAAQPTAAPAKPTSPPAAAAPAKPAASPAAAKPAPAAPAPSPAAAAQAKPAGGQLAQLYQAAKAANEGTVIWYESSPPEQIDKVIRAFNATYPDVKVQHVRLVGGLDIAARMIQESQADAPSADVGSTGGDQAAKLDERGLLMNADWAALGVPQELVVQKPSAVEMAASVYVILYNTRQVPEAEAPKNWDDLLDPKWKGKLGTWASAAGLAHLAEAWGDERTTEYVRKFAAQEPLLYASTFPLAQAVASGEVSVGFGIYHTAQPPIKQGAPLKVEALDPTTVSTIYTFVSKNSKNPNGAKLLVGWLMTPNGARAYEEATSRGSVALGPDTARLVRGKKIAEFPPSELGRFSKLLAEYNEILKRGGKSAG